MSVHSGSVLNRPVVAAFVLAAIWALLPPPPVAAIGEEVLPPLTLQSPAACTSFSGGSLGTIFGTSVGVVQGSKVGPAFLGLPQFPVLLVTTCLWNGTDKGTSTINATIRATLHFVDPSTGQRQRSIITKDATTGVTLGPGWGFGALTPRPDKGDLLACVSPGTDTGAQSIYAIKYSAHLTDQTDIGKATLLVGSGSGSPNNSPNTGKLCDGLAYDAVSKTIYQSKNGGTSISRWQQHANGTFVKLADLPAPTVNSSACVASGLALFDGALLVACQAGTPNNAGHIVNKITGALLTSLPQFTATIGADLECDPVTFASSNRDGLWTRLMDSNTLSARLMPGFTCGRSTGPSVISASSKQNGAVPPFTGPGACPAAYTGNDDADIDHDGLLACWKMGSLWPPDPPGSGVCVDANNNIVGCPGIDFDGDGNRDVKLCVNTSGNVDALGGDIFGPDECAAVGEKDLFVEADFMAQHPPDDIAIARVVTAFANAPVDGGAGIKLHVQVDDEDIPFNSAVAFEPVTAAASTATSPSATLTLIATSGLNVTATTSSGTFAASDVCRLIRPALSSTGQAGLGRAVIKSFVNPTQVVLDILAPFTTTSLASGSWSLVNELDFDAVKSCKFGTASERAQGQKTIFAKRMAVRYALTAHNQKGTSSSGVAKVGGDGLMVSLGSFTSGDSTDQWAGTFMHEFGHTLGLRHGGGQNPDANANCKPNYLSVMSYAYQFDGRPVTNRPLDFSGEQLPTLNEGGLVASAGIGDPNVDSSLQPYSLPDTTSLFQRRTVFGPGSGLPPVVTPAGPAPGTPLVTTPINWTSTDINQLTVVTAGVPTQACDGLGTVLTGHNDWENLQYSLRASLDSTAGGGGSDELREIDPVKFEGFFGADTNGDGVPDNLACPVDPSKNCACQIDYHPNDGGANSLNLTPPQPGAEPIAILSTVCNGHAFDATTVDPETITVSPGNGLPKRSPQGRLLCTAVDVNGDGIPDLLCKIIMDVGPGNTEIILEARTFLGVAIRAKDTIHIVGGGNP